MGRRVSENLDCAWKEALTGQLQHFLALFLPEVHRDIDWSTHVEFLESELRRLRRGLRGQRQQADIVARVRRLSGQDTVVVVHVEVQSQWDGTLPLRMRLYNDRLFESYRCPVYSLVVLGDRLPHWRPSSYESEIWGCRTSLEFPVLKLLDWRGRRAELEGSDNPFALVVAAHLAVLETRPDQPSRLHKALRLVRLLLERGFTQDQVDGLFHLLEGMMPMSDALYEVFEREVTRLEEEYGMTLITRSELKGMKRGRQEGRQEGREEGRELGLSEGQRLTILTVAAARFGEVPAELAEALEAVSDSETLRRLARTAATAATAEELLKATRQEGQRHQDA